MRFYYRGFIITAFQWVEEDKWEYFCHDITVHTFRLSDMVSHINRALGVRR